MRNVYIINPKAGKHDHTVQFMERIRAVHATHGEEPEIYLTCLLYTSPSPRD